MNNPKQPHTPALPPDNPEMQEALRIAVQENDRSTVHTLLSAGVDIEPMMRGVGYNRLVLGARFNLPEIVAAEHAKGTHEAYYYHEALHFAAGEGHRALVYQILEYGFDATSTKDFDIAGAAMIGGHVPLLQEFMAKGYLTDLTCRHMLEGVIEGDHGNMLDFVLHHGADQDIARLILRKCEERNPKDHFDKVKKTFAKWFARWERFPEENRHDYKPQTLQDLRCGTGNESGFIHMAKAERFDEVMQIAAQSGQDKITLEDLLQKDRHGNNTLEILGTRRHLNILMQPEAWIQRPEAFMQIYNHIPPVYQKQVSPERMEAATRRNALRNLARQKNLRPKGL